MKDKTDMGDSRLAKAHYAEQMIFMVQRVITVTKVPNDNDKSL